MSKHPTMLREIRSTWDNSFMFNVYKFDKRTTLTLAFWVATPILPIYEFTWR